MKSLFYSLLAKLKGKNSASTPKEVIAAQMDELRPLPIGRVQFMDWSDRIISGALVEADKESQRFALTEMIMHLPPNKSFCEDAFFINGLRRVAVNQTCITMMTEIKEAHKAAQLLKSQAEVKPEGQSTEDAEASKLAKSGV
jgi:hypothetical protein